MVVGILSVKVIEILKLIVRMKKAGQQNYLDEDKYSLVISSTNIEDGHVLPLDCRGVSKQYQNIVNSVKYHCGDNYILEKLSVSYCQE